MQSGDYAAALAELTPLAAHGNAIAQYNLGRMYYYGQGVPRDLDQATSLFRQSAAQGNPDGENNLGAGYETGEGLPQDYSQASALFRNAAVQGNAKAEYNL